MVAQGNLIGFSRVIVDSQFVENCGTMFICRESQGTLKSIESRDKVLLLFSNEPYQKVVTRLLMRWKCGDDFWIKPWKVIASGKVVQFRAF